MKIGLITYHSAYNFGSVLQAYATQEILKKYGCVEMINYRMPSQKNYYSIFPKGMSFKTNLKYALSLYTIKLRLKRQEKYEKTFVELFNLTKEFNEPIELSELSETYDIYVSGSDQIWNRHSNELFNVDWLKYMAPYLLEFTHKKKISYASSIVNMDDSDLKQIKDKISDFDYISCREESSANRISQLIKKDVTNVLDPTFLISGDTWKQLYKGKTEITNNLDKYIVYYSLKGTRALNRDLKYLSEKYSNLGYKIIAIVPLAFVYPYKNVIIAADVAVYDFLALLDNANHIITDSYHGTILSINMNKSVFSLQEKPGKNLRIEDVSKKLEFQECIVYDIKDIDFENAFDYTKTNKLIEKYRMLSKEYLDKSIYG